MHQYVTNSMVKSSLAAIAALHLPKLVSVAKRVIADFIPSVSLAVTYFISKINVIYIIYSDSILMKSNTM